MCSIRAEIIQEVGCEICQKPIHPDWYVKGSPADSAGTATALSEKSQGAGRLERNTAVWNTAVSLHTFVKGEGRHSLRV